MSELSIVLSKIKDLWNYVQDLMDVSGDSIMAVMSTVFIVRVAASMLSKFPPLTASEAAFYSAAIASFAYSNKGPRQ